MMTKEPFLTRLDFLSDELTSSERYPAPLPTHEHNSPLAFLRKACEIMGITLPSSPSEKEEAEADSLPLHEGMDSFSFGMNLERTTRLELSYLHQDDMFLLRGVVGTIPSRMAPRLYDFLLQANFVLADKKVSFSLNPITKEVFLRSDLPHASHVPQDLADRLGLLASLTQAWREFIDTVHLKPDALQEGAEVPQELLQGRDTFRRI